MKQAFSWLFLGILMIAGVLALRWAPQIFHSIVG